MVASANLISFLSGSSLLKDLFSAPSSSTHPLKLGYSCIPAGNRFPAFSPCRVPAVSDIHHGIRRYILHILH